MDTEARALLAIYLHDHMAVALGGVELAQRLADGESDEDLKGPVRRLAEDFEEDAEALRATARALGIAERAPVKEALAWVGEKLGRLKLNGHLVSRSPLSRVIELEGLQVCVQGKLALWRTLRELEVEPELPCATLLARAERQREQLEELHRVAVRRAFEAS